jgi:hypothetical protein
MNAEKKGVSVPEIFPSLLILTKSATLTLGIKSTGK